MLPKKQLTSQKSSRVDCFVLRDIVQPNSIDSFPDHSTGSPLRYGETTRHDVRRRMHLSSKLVAQRCHLNDTVWKSQAQKLGSEIQMMTHESETDHSVDSEDHGSSVTAHVHLPYVLPSERDTRERIPKRLEGAQS